MPAVLADTHSALWYLLQPTLLSRNAERALDHATEAGDPILIASISLVEVRYLTERGRLPLVALESLFSALAAPLPGLVLAPLDVLVARAVERVPRDQVPDMPDRIIAATALALGVPLVTRDGRIRRSQVPTIW